MTRVAILNQYFYPENVTSATLAFELAVGLAQKGYDVEAITGMPHEYHDGDVPKNETINGVSIKRIEYSFHDRARKSGRIRNYFSFFFSIYRNRRLLRDIDVLIVYSSPPVNPIVPALFSRRYGYKMIYVVYDLYPDIAFKFGYMRENGICSRLFEHINKFVYSRCASIVVLSTEMKKYFSKHKGYGDKVVVIPNWYSDTDENTKPVKSRRDVFRVLYGGNLGIVQDIDTLLDGIEKLSGHDDIEFNFATHGNRKQYFFDEIKRRGITSVTDLGHLRKTDYDKSIRSANLAIISVDKKIAGLASPSKYYSYLAKSTPVVFIGPRSMDIAKEIIHEDLGYVVDNLDAQGFTDAIIHAKNHPDELQTMQRNVRNVFTAKYTKATGIDKYACLINEIAGED